MAKGEVGLVLALDGEKEFIAALRSAKESVSLAKDELKRFDESHKGAANSMQTLIDKQKKLENVQNAFKQQLATAEAGLDKSNENLKKIADATEHYERKLASLRAEQAKHQKGSDEYKQLEQDITDAANALDKQRAAQNREVQSYTSFQRAIKQASAGIKSMDNELAKNEKYLEEARNSSDGCATSIDNMGKEIKQAGDAASSASSDFDSLSDIIGGKFESAFSKNRMIELAIDGLRRLERAAMDAAKYVVKVGSDFEAQMDKVAAISGATSTEMTQLSDYAKELGRTTVYSASEAGSAMEQMALAGWKANEITQSTAGVLDLASASGMDLSRAAEYMTDNLNAFGLSASDAGRMADIMATAMSNSSMTTEDLGEAYGKVAATTHAYGFSVEEVTAVLMTMANQGKKGGEAGTALNTIMTRLATNTAKAADKLAEVIGHDAMYDESGNMRSLTSILDSLGEAWVNMSQQEQNALAKTIAGTRQSNALNIVLAGLSDSADAAGRSFGKYKDMLADCNGEASRMADTMLDNLQGDFTLLGDAAESLGISIYENLAPMLRGATQWATGAINAWTEAITPQKTLLSGFIADIQSGNQEVENLLANSQASLEQGEMDVAEINTYIDILERLNGKTNLNKLEQYELKTAVEALSDVIPGLSDAFDETSGTLSMNNTLLEEGAEKARAYAMAAAIVAAEQDAMAASLKAEINLESANAAYDAAIKARDAYVETLGGMDKAYTWIGGELEYADKTVEALSNDVAQAEIAQKDAQQASAEAESQMEATSAAADNLREKYGLVGEEALSAAEGEEELISSTAGSAEAIQAVKDATEELEATTEVPEEISKAYNDMYESIQKSISGSVGLFKEFSGGNEASLSEVQANLESQIAGIEAWKENMQKLSAEIGDTFTQELYDKLAEMGPESANFVQQLVESLQAEDGQFESVAAAWSEALALDDDVSGVADATTAGQEYAAALAEGLTGSEGDMTEAATQLMEAVTNVWTENESAVTEIGDALGVAFGTSLGSKTGESKEAGTGLASSGVEGAGSKNSDFNSTGYNAAAGFAQGIANGQSLAISAAIAMATAALQAAKDAISVASPSRKFRDELGLMSARGFALGIKKGAPESIDAATKMSSQTFDAAVKWLDEYKKAEDVSAADEQFFWKKMASTAEEGSKAYSTSVHNMAVASLKDAGFTAMQAEDITARIRTAFDVSWYKEADKDGKRERKDVEDYYKEVYDAAKKYAKNQSILRNWTIREELSYYQKLKTTLKTHTQAWYDCVEQTHQLYEKLKQEEAKLTADKANNIGTILDYFKVYRDVSNRAEMQYWDMARRMFKAGTKERIEADKNYKSAKEAYYKELEQVEKDYAENSKKIQEDLEKQIEELTQKYNDAVKAREEEILGSMNLFESFDAQGYDKNTLVANLEGQVDALELWEQKLQELKDRGISAELYQYLLDQGVDGLVNVSSIADMTDEELDYYEQLFKRRSNLAHDQAVKDNEGLKAETQNAILEAKNTAAKALKDLKKEYKKQLKEINKEISGALVNMLNVSGQIASESVARLFSKLKLSKKDKEGLKESTKAIEAEFDALKPKLATVGGQAMDGLLTGLKDRKKIDAAVRSSVDAILDSFKRAANIHSPSRLFRDDIGNNLIYGVAEGITEGTDKAIEASEEAIRSTLGAAEDALTAQNAQLRESAAGVANSGISALNALLDGQENRPVVNVDNTGLYSIMSGMVESMQTMMDTLQNMQIVLDTGATVGGLAEKMDEKFAENRIRRNRGRR